MQSNRALQYVGYANVLKVLVYPEGDSTLPRAHCLTDDRSPHYWVYKPRIHAHRISGTLDPIKMLMNCLALVLLEITDAVGIAGVAAIFGRGRG